MNLAKIGLAFFSARMAQLDQRVVFLKRRLQDRSLLRVQNRSENKGTKHANH